MSLSEYIKETRVELKHVSWPTRNQTLVYSLVVILISIGVALFLGLLDYAFKAGLQSLIG
jgi:preprotein translocase subunit SecE